MKSNKILLIMAQTGFLFEGCKFEGYTVYHPYRFHGLISRLLREFVFRFIPVFSSIFFNKKIFNGEFDSILIWDPLITKRFIEKLHKKHPKSTINFIYWNMVGKCSHLKPAQIPNYVKKWTYDGYDSEEYNIKLYSSYPYFKKYIRPHESNKYDVLFVGRDKGRGEYLINLENELNKLGLRTKFIITKSDRLSKKKSYYHKELTYEDICELISQSKAVLNVIMENQQGITLRDLEYVYQDVKLITTNPSIRDTPIYHPNNVFILSDRDIKDLPDFLNLPMYKLSAKILNSHTLDSFISEITQNE